MKMGGGAAAGGGAMRAAVKVAGYGVGCKLRGSTSAPRPDQSVTGGLAARKVPRPSSVGMVTSSPMSEEVGAGGASPVRSANGRNERVGLDRSVQMPAWEFDDWELAGVEEEEEEEEERPMARVVFGGSPTWKEAQEATSDLRGIIEQEYFPSHPTTGSRKCINALHEPLLAVASLSGRSETKDLVTSQDAVAPATVSTSALLAFKMLKESRDVQTIVTSLATDKNVWNAVTNNDMVVEFIKNNKISTFISVPDDVRNSDNDQKSSSRFDDDAKDSEGSENVFAKLMNKIRLVLEKMIGNLSELVQSIFTGTGADLSVNANGSNDDKAAFKTSFMALAVLAVVVVVMKRA